MAAITILSRAENIGMFGGQSYWVFQISSVDAANIQSYHYGLSIDTLSGTNKKPSLISDPWSEIYTGFGFTSDPYDNPFGWSITNPSVGLWYISFGFFVPGVEFTNVNDWTNFKWAPETPITPTTPTAPTTSSSLPILLQWSNAFDVDYNIEGYELSYKTTGSWQDIAFISSSQTSGSYSFTPQQLITHTFRVRIRDTGGEVSEYKYFNYVITSNYQISSEYSFQGGENSCPITVSNTNTYSPIFLSSEPPALNVVVYTNSIQTNTFNGMILLANQYWIIKSPSGLFYSCKINSTGVIVEAPYLCGVGKTARISAGRVGNTVAGFCDLQLTNNVYWNTTDTFAIGTKLYSDSGCTTPFIGAKLFYIVEYIDVSTSVTLTKVVQIGTNADTSVIVSIVNKATVCSLIRPGFRSDPNANCASTSTISCHIRSADPVGVASGDIVCINSSGTPFPGGDLTYRVYITTLQVTNQIYALCKINNDGLITVTPTYCSNFGIDLGGGYYGGTGYTGGSGPKIICNLLYSQGFLSKEIWEADEKFGRLMIRKNKEVLFGYLTWAKPVVKFLTKNPQYSKYLYLVSKPWNEHMAYTMGVLPKDNKIGKIIHYIGSKFSILVYKLITSKRRKRRK